MIFIPRISSSSLPEKVVHSLHLMTFRFAQGQAYNQ